MKKYVSLDKRSKKAQKEYYSKQRLTWGVLNPGREVCLAGRLIIEKKINRKDEESAKSSEMDLMPIFLIN